MPNVMFLDDSEERYTAIRAAHPDWTIDWAKTAAEAIGLIAQNANRPYDTVMLDHDLGCPVISGSHVVAALAAFDSYKESQIVIHSSNPVAARKMKNILGDAGFTVVILVAFPLLVSQK